MIPRGTSERNRVRILLAGLFLLALGLRSIGLDHLLPHSHEDDADLARQTWYLREHGGWRDVRGPSINRYPTLVSRLAAVWPLPSTRVDDAEGADLDEHLAAASADFLRVRHVVSLFAAALAPLTFLLTRRLLGGTGALFAALLIAFDPLHLLFSGQARPHGAFATLALAAVLASMELRRRPTRSAYLLAGLAVGLALGALHSGVALFLPLLFAHLTRERGEPKPPFRRILWALLPIAACFAFFYRDILLLLMEQSRIVRSDTVVVGPHRVSAGAFDGTGFQVMARHLFESNPVLTVLTASGMAALVIAVVSKRVVWVVRGDVAVALSFALPYFLVLGSYGPAPERFVLPLLPFFAVLASWMVFACRRRLARPVSVVVALLLLALPALTASKLVWLRTQPDTYEQLATLLAGEPGGERALIAAPIEVPLFYSRATLGLEGDGPGSTGLWSEYQRRERPEAPPGSVHSFQFLRRRRGVKLSSVDDVVRILEERACPYVVVEVSGVLLAHPEARHLLQAAETWGTLYAQLRPDDLDGGYQRRLDYSIPDAFLRRMISARALGAELRVFVPRR